MRYSGVVVLWALVFAGCAPLFIHWLTGTRLQRVIQIPTKESSFSPLSNPDPTGVKCTIAVAWAGDKEHATGRIGECEGRLRGNAVPPFFFGHRWAQPSVVAPTGCCWPARLFCSRLVRAGKSARSGPRPLGAPGQQNKRKSTLWRGVLSIWPREHVVTVIATGEISSGDAREQVARNHPRAEAERDEPCPG